jgi:hypothetical protein
MAAGETKVGSSEPERSDERQREIDAGSTILPNTEQNSSVLRREYEQLA